MTRLGLRSAAAMCALASALKTHHPKPVVLSSLVYEPFADVRDLVNNAMKFTEETTSMVLHLNALQNYTRADVGAIIALGGDARRILINPTRLEVSWGNVNMTYAFLLNAKYVFNTLGAHWDRHHGGRDAIIIWQDSNMYFFRPCVESYARLTRCTLFESHACDGSERYDGTPEVRAFLSRNGTVCSRGKGIKHEGSVFSLLMLVEMLNGLSRLGAFSGKQGKLGWRWTEEWAFPLFASGRNCTGERICPYNSQMTARGKVSAVDYPREVIKYPRDSDFAYKRVLRTLEIEKEMVGVEADGQKHGHSRAIAGEALERQKKVRELYVGFPRPPANHTCTCEPCSANCPGHGDPYREGIQPTYCSHIPRI